MRRKATVERILPDGSAELLVRRENMCSGDCHQCGGCGGVEQVLRFQAKDPLGVETGDIVYVESDGAVVLKGVFLLYLLPMALFVIGYLAALSLKAWAIAIGGGGFVIGLVPAVLYDRYVKKHPPEYVIVGFVK